MKTSSLSLRLLLGLVVVSHFSPACIGQEAAPAAAASSEPEEDPYAWSIRSYRMPWDLLSSGFVTQEKGQLNLPKMPPADAKPEEIQSFIKRSSVVLEQFFKKQGIVLPAGSLAVMDGVHEVMAVRTTGETHGQIAVISAGIIGNVPKQVALRVDVLEAETAEVLKVMDEAANIADHAALLERLEAQAAAGKGRLLGSSRVDTKSGQRAIVNCATHSDFGTEFEINEKGSSGTSAYESRQVGTIVEFDPVIGADGIMIDLNYSIEHHLAPPIVRGVPVATLNDRRVEVPVTDFFTAEIQTSITFRDGHSRLAGVWQAMGEGSSGRQVVAFLTGKIVPLLAADSPLAVTWLKEQGEKVAATPARTVPKEEDTGVVSGMIVRRYQIPPDFASTGGPSTSAPADAFAAAPPASEPRFQIQATALDVLRAQGIPFPEGSSANYLSATSELIVRNLPKNMELVEAYIESISSSTPKQLELALYIVQADGATLRRLDRAAMGLADHSELWAALQTEIAAGRATLVSTSWIETRSGQRARSAAGVEYLWSTGASAGEGGGSSTPSSPDKATAVATATASSSGGLQTASATFEMEKVGLIWEVDPVIGADGATIDLSTDVTYHTAAPTHRDKAPVNDIQTLRIDSPEVDFHKGKTTTAITLRDGMKHLLGLWKPRGTPELENADLLQAVFVDARILKVE